MDQIRTDGTIKTYVLLATDADGLGINLCGAYGTLKEARREMLDRLLDKVDAELAEMPDDVATIEAWHNSDFSVIISEDAASATYDVTHCCNYAWQIIGIANM